MPAIMLIVPTLQRGNVVLTLQRRHTGGRERTESTTSVRLSLGTLLVVDNENRGLLGRGDGTSDGRSGLGNLEARKASQGTGSSLNDHRSTGPAAIFSVGPERDAKGANRTKKACSTARALHAGKAQKRFSAQFTARPPRRCPGRRRCTGWRGRPWHRA